MVIVIVDDERLTRETLHLSLRELGHTCRTYADGADALVALTPNVDLVIADVIMKGVSGIELAQRVADRLGSAPPRTLLISGEDMSDQLDRLSPSVIVGWLPKPFLHSDLFRVLEVVETTRRRCPGLSVSACLCAAAGSAGSAGAKGAGRLCNTPRYAHCPHYGQGSGDALQSWIAGCRGRWSSDIEALLVDTDKRGSRLRSSTRPRGTDRSTAGS